MKTYFQNEQEDLDNQLLNFLKSNGFPINELGTYLYEEVLRDIITILTNASTESEVIELKNQVLNPYSQFYFNIARNDNDMGLKTFHEYINKAIEKANLNHNSNKLIKRLSKDNKLDYKELAFNLGISIIKLNEEEQNLSNRNLYTHKLTKNV